MYSLRKFGSVIAIVVLAVLFTVGSVSPAHAVAYTVTTANDELVVNGNCSLREAILSAVTHTAIDACPQGTGNDLILFAPNVTTVNITSPLPAITAGNTVTIYGSPQKRTFNANLSGNVFTANAGSTLTITNIIFSGSIGGDCIKSAGTLNLQGDYVPNCVWGVEATAGQVNIQTSTVMRVSTTNGNVSFTASDSTFSGGVPFTVLLGSGGGNITRSTFGAGQVHITTTGPLTVTRTIFNGVGNIADISASATTVNVTNSILIGTTQMALNPENNAQFNVFNSTIINNANGVAGTGTVHFRNTVLSNTVNCGPAAITVVDGGGNLQSSASCGSIPVGNTALGANYTPQAGSPLIDNGITVRCSTVDYYGAPRPIDGDGNGSALCDIGAVEKQ